MKTKWNDLHALGLVDFVLLQKSESPSVAGFGGGSK